MANNDQDLTPEYLQYVQQKYGWAVQIIRKHFAKGLDSIGDKAFLDSRYAEFQQKHDPIYADLLCGMGHEQLAKTFVSYWIIAQTIATQSRFWLEAAVAEIIIHQAKQRWRPAREVYSHAMLAQRCQASQLFPTWRRPIDQIGNFELEDLADSSPWRVPLPRNVLQTIDLLVGEQEREAASVRKRFRRQQWSQEDDE